MVMSAMKKILVVDDSADIITAIKRGLEEISTEFNVVGAESGSECIDFLKANKPDLILLDIMMPEMNGWRVFKILRENEKWKSIPVVFLTAKADNFSKAYGKIISNEYVEKPFKIKDLKDKIENILENPSKNLGIKAEIIDDMIKNIPS